MDEQLGGRFDWLGLAVAAVAIGGLAFGLVRGQEEAWADPWPGHRSPSASSRSSRSRSSWRPASTRSCPLSLFRSRTFATINLATFFIYGALYVTFSYQGLVFQGVLGYTALAAGATALPIGLMLTLLSARVGPLAARLGARRFLVIGPTLMACGLLWYTRLPADSDPWLATIGDPASLIPPTDMLIDILPAIVLFGAGLCLVVAPLTTTLMGSVPGRVCRSRERHQQRHLAGGAAAPRGAHLHRHQRRRSTRRSARSCPASTPPATPSGTRSRHSTRRAARRPQSRSTPARIASIEAFHQAMFVGAALLGIGAAIDFVGLRPATSAGEARPRHGSRRMSRAARLGRPDVRPDRRSDDPLGHRASSIVCPSTATSGCSTPGAAAAE